MNRGLKIARALYKDEGSPRSRGEVPTNHINHSTNQGGGAAYGRRASRGGGAGAERQEHGDHIDAGRNKRPWPCGAGVSASNPKTGNVRMKGRIPRRGGQYGGGGRDTQ